VILDEFEYLSSESGSSGTRSIQSMPKPSGRGASKEPGRNLLADFWRVTTESVHRFRSFLPARLEILQRGGGFLLERGANSLAPAKGALRIEHAAAPLNRFVFLSFGAFPASAPTRLALRCQRAVFAGSDGGAPRICQPRPRKEADRQQGDGNRLILQKSWVSVAS